jgi:hypothetical protein
MALGEGAKVRDCSPAMVLAIVQKNEFIKSGLGNDYIVLKS